MKKVFTFFAMVVVLGFFLSVFGWMASHITEGDKSFGWLNRPVQILCSYPDLIAQSIEGVGALPDTFVKTPAGFSTVNELDFDVLVLTSYSDEDNTRSIVLRNLRNDAVLYKWTVKNPYKPHDRLIHPLLLPDHNLVYSFMDKSVFRIDSQSRIVWQQDGIFSDHSINPDSNGDFWVCSKRPVWHATGVYKIGGRSVYYLDNGISKLDAETGQILFHKSISEILKENNLARYLIKSAQIKDPIHVNDIQPALKTTAYYLYCLRYIKAT